MDTVDQYNETVRTARDIFLAKTTDYGTAWTVLRPVSIVDQIFIKAMRIRTLQETGVSLVGDDIPGEFLGIINYAVIGLIQLVRGSEPAELPSSLAVGLYDSQVAIARDVMLSKNHDYGEAWRNMSQEGLTDLILMKLLRIRQILANKGVTLISEGVDAGYVDILNYAIFALILTQS
jgi:hypothetical protein